jgi:DNA invertase Pin-like site-specific DNA recombinase
MKKAIAYYRVSTKRQGKSGLGLKAQRNAVLRYARGNKLEIIREYKEVRSTRKNNRHKLFQALDDCKEFKSMLLVAKLDRLDRNVAFISKLMEAKVGFIAVDNPHANKLNLHINAAFAEHERDEISIRIKESLAVAKSNGVELGKYGRRVLSKRNKRKANQFARKMRPVILALRGQGYTSVRKIADRLNEKRMRPYTGRKARWHPSTVFSLLKRIKQLD